MTYLPVLSGQPIKRFAYVTPEQAQDIWRHASIEIELFVKVLWWTGLRISEVLRLRTTDLKADGREYNLLITRSKRRNAQPELLPIPAGLGETLEGIVILKGVDQ